MRQPVTLNDAGECGLFLTRRSGPFPSGCFLLFVKWHQTGLNPIERGFQSACGIHAADLSFHFRWLTECAQKAIGSHSNRPFAINGLPFA